MQILSKIKNLFIRNLAFSNSFLIKSGAPSYTNWTIQKAVKDGYKASSWVYRAVSLISKSAASVPWGVVNEDGEYKDHYLSDLIEHPNNAISRQDMFELLVSWLELGGNSYLKAVKAGGRTSELWPVSPDRLKPVLSKDITEWIKGYALDQSIKSDYETDEIIHFKYFDPASPYTGLGPLQAVCKTVDTDVDQLDWNKSAMQNRGVLDGVFSFKREFRSQEQADAVAEKLNERYAGSDNARRIGVIGSEAKYVRTALTPVQMDFIDSRKFNRDEIFIIFGVPPQYAGTQESSTYNNYQTSELIFWFQKIIPLLDDLRDTFNFFFHNELGKDKITYNLNSIPAIRRALLERSKTAKTLFDMGVPVSQLNSIFEFGIKEYDGWEQSYVKTQAATSVEIKSNPGHIETRGLLLKRNLEKEAEDKENFAIDKAKDIEILLGDQQEIIFDAIETNSSQGIVNFIDPEKLLTDTFQDWIDLYTTLTFEYARIAAGQVVVEKRAIDSEMQALIDEYFAEEAIVLKEKSMIADTTIKKLIGQVEEGIENAWTVSQLQQAIVDTGVFSPERSLMLSRTITGTAGSIGQYVSAKDTGATHKKWINSGFEVRDLHIARAGEPAVKINERFSAKAGASLGPMYPLDLCLKPADRVNCFLPGTKIEGKFIKAMKSSYHGKAVEIVTVGGSVLRVTGKHPIFTEKGFVPADSIKNRDNLLACERDIKGPISGRNLSLLSSSFPADKNNSPADIEQIFSAFFDIGFNELRGGSAADFHGDGQFVKGDIEIVGANRPLLVDNKSIVPKICGEIILKFKDFILNFECCVSSGNFPSNRVDISLSGLPSSGALTLDQLSVFFKRFPFDEFCFRPSSEIDTVVPKDSVNRPPRNVEHFGKGLDAFATFIKGDNPFGVTLDVFVSHIDAGRSFFDFSIVKDFVKGRLIDVGITENFRDRHSGKIRVDNVNSVNHFDYSDFVYDVETPYGWLVANGLIVSNCRCSTLFEIRQ
jgi:HK97 family phage portal protein